MAETVGSLIVTAILSAEVANTAVIGSVTVAQIVGSATLLAGSVGLNALLASNAGESKPSDGQLTTRQPMPDRWRYYGNVKVGGKIVFSETLDGVRYQMLALNQGLIDGFEQHWFADSLAIVDGSVSSGGNVVNMYGGLVFIDPQFGTDIQAANTLLTAKFPGIWTANHRGRGICNMLVATRQAHTAKDHGLQYPGGMAPVYRAVIRASRYWDPRQAWQDRNDPATWTWGGNPALIALDYHRHKDAMGLQPFDDVFFNDAAIQEDWIPAANICDESIPQKAGGFLPRYSCAGGYALPSPAKDTLAAILATCDGQTYQRGDGAIGIRVGKTVAPTVTLGPGQIIGYDGLNQGSIDRLTPVNTVTAKYTDRTLDFQEADADPWVDEDLLDEFGREESSALNLLWVPVHSQARRLMKMAFHRANPEWAGTIVTNLGGFTAYNERYIRIQLPEAGIDRSFEVTSFVADTATLTCTIGVASIDQAAFDWAPVEEGTAPRLPDAISSEPIDPPENLETDVELGVISMTWDVSDRAGAIAEAQVSEHEEEEWFDIVVTDTNDSAATSMLTAGDYDVRVRFRVGGLVSDWTSELEISVT